MSEKKKKTIIIVGAIVAVLVIVYIVALLTGNVKQQEPSERLNLAKKKTLVLKKSVVKF